jgi:hypothetical protein
MDRKNAKWRFYVKALVISFPPVLSLIQRRALNTITMSAPLRSHKKETPVSKVSVMASVIARLTTHRW